MKIHLCDGGLERAVCAGTGFRERVWKGFGANADLREGESHFTDNGLERARLEPVGLAGASLSPLIAIGVEVIRALETHGDVEEHFCYARESMAEAC